MSTRAALLRALGPLAAEGPNGVRVTPTTERQLVDALHVLASSRATLGKDVLLSREGFSQVGPIAPKAGTALIGAGVRLQTAEATLREQGLTLGGLPHGAWALTLAEFLEGRHQGLRAVAGGRLEPVCQSLSGVLGDGRILATPDSPRSAAGPELMALFLGMGGRLGLVTRASVRCFPVAETERRAAFGFATPTAAVQGLKAAIADGVVAKELWFQVHDGAVHCELELQGTRAAVERDVASLQRRIGEASGRALTTFSPAPIDGDEREASWAQVAAALEKQAWLSCTRLSLASVVAKGGVDGVPLGPTGEPPPPALLQAFDGRHVLGGSTR